MRTSSFAYALHNSISVAEPHYTYFSLDRALTKPERWCGLSGFPIGLAVVPDLDQLWISTSTDTCVADCSGDGELDHRDAELGSVPELPVQPPPELGDPDVWTEHQRTRLLAENAGSGLIDLEIDGWFPTTVLIMTFDVRGMGKTVFARALTVFDMDGYPRLWQGAPTLMDLPRHHGIRRAQTSTTEGPWPLRTHMDLNLL